jgi:NADPH:quinone reductase-like Zn-dependent oxidoreductase
MRAMKAVCMYSYGGPSVLKYEDIPRPHPADGEVLVRVHAVGINAIDWKIREGEFKAILHHTLPLVPGWDVSGVVEAVGLGTKRVKIGDAVFSRADLNRDGAYAEYVVIKESELALKPQSIDHIHSAALPVAGLTAWQTLIEAAGLLAGQRVLIHAAAGGVGHIAVQLAKWKGAHVIGTASARNHDFLKKLGVQQVIDHETVRFEDAVHAVDVVLDTLGGETQERSWKVLNRGGILVSIVSPPSQASADQYGVRQAFVSAQPNLAQLTEIARLADEQQLRAVVETILPLSDATRGQELSQRGHTRGKIVLRVV